MGEREFPIAIPSFCWKNFWSTWKYVVFKQTRYVSATSPTDIISCRNVTVWNLRSCFCGAPTLTRGRVCNLQESNIWSQVSEWARYIGILSDWPSVVMWLNFDFDRCPFQVGGVSDETDKNGYGSCATRNIEWYHCKLQTRPLVREGVPKQDRKFQTATFRPEVISGRKSHKSARYQDILTEWPSVVKWLRTSNNYRRQIVSERNQWQVEQWKLKCVQWR
jgi:hypothetical protein